MRLKLEVFENAGAAPARTDTVVLDTGSLEEAKLDAFETGYAAGWEDAIAAQGEEQSRLRADLARNLQALSFSYAEARSHILQALEPLMEEMVARLLPPLARESFCPLLLETLIPLAGKLADTPVTLVINPCNRVAVETALARETALPLAIEEEGSLGEGQAYLRSGRLETRLDLDRAVSEIAEAVRGFFALNRKDSSHG